MLDTDAVSYIARGHPAEYRERLSAIPEEQLCVSVITIAEILIGLKDLPSSDIRQTAVLGYLDRFEIVPWEESIPPIFAVIQHHLTSTGQKIGEMDVLITTHAVALGATLVTGNIRHHGCVPGLEIADWRQQPSGGG